MGNYIPLILSTFVYIVLFVYVIASTQIQELREDWNTVRCQPLAMFFASYIPTDPSVSRAKFSNENFQFCMGEMMDASMNLMMAPVTALFESQVEVAHTTQQSINNLRNSAASDVSSPFHVMINYAWQKFQTIMAQVLRVMYNFNSAFQRIFGITLSALFAGVSVFRVIDNMISFIIKIIIIILTIIIVMMFLLFIFIQPLIATIIIPVIIAISATAAGSSAGGMAGSFTGANCVAPETLVKTKDGWKKVQDLQLGEALWEGTVEGILRGKGSAAVSIYSVRISAMHIVYDSSASRWVFAKDHPAALPCSTPPVVYSLVTSSRTWIVSDERELLLRDWTHADGNDEAIQRKVCSFLEAPFTGTKPMGLLGPETRIICKGMPTLVPLNSLRLGDKVWDGKNYTKVISLYRSSELGNAFGPTSSAWTLCPLSAVGGRNGWKQIPVPVIGKQVPQMHCGTESGTIAVDGIIVRDFNEIDKKDFYAFEEFLLSLL